MHLEPQDLRDFLESKFEQYHQPKFLESDPIQIPRSFSRKEDVEIAGFLSATIAWGQRPTIINNGRKLMQLMDESPYEFVKHASPNELNRFDSFCHRTFNGIDARYFIQALQHLYRAYGGLEAAFTPPHQTVHPKGKASLIAFRDRFFALPFPHRTQKHVSNPNKGSSAKRLNMFLRWMVRSGLAGVDFGIWNVLSPADLYCPLDVHSGNVARKLGLLERKINDWKSVEELTETLRQFDASDPVKYDFALFGLGAFEKF